MGASFGLTTVGMHRPFAKMASTAFRNCLGYATIPHVLRSDTNSLWIQDEISTQACLFEIVWNCVMRLIRTESVIT